MAASLLLSALALTTVLAICHIKAGSSQLASAVIPLYNSPNFNDNDLESWKPLIDAKNKYKNVTAWVIGTVPKNGSEKRFAEGYKKLMDNGVNMLCYVNTAHATLTTKNVTGNIDRCRDFFKTFVTLPSDRTGIFFDNMHNGRTDSNQNQKRPKEIPVKQLVDYYTTVSKDAKSKGLKMTVANPASYVHEDLVNVMDIFYILESRDGFKDDTRYQPSANLYKKKYPIDKFAVLISNVTEGELSKSKIDAPKPYVKHIWVTEMYTSGAPTHYRLPRYTVKLFEYLSY